MNSTANTRRCPTGRRVKVLVNCLLLKLKVDGDVRPHTLSLDIVSILLDTLLTDIALTW